MLHLYEYLWRHAHRPLPQIYFSLVLRTFALSLIGIFVPLYLYKEMGFSFAETISFYLFYSVVFAIATPLAAKFAARFGVKHTIIMSVPFYLLFILLLYLLPTLSIPLWLIAACAGVSLPFYWMGIHLLFYQASDHSHRGAEFGLRQAFTVLGGMFGPLLGGLTIFYYGFSAIFLLVTLLLLCSGLILFLTKENHIRYHFSLRSIINKDHWKDSLYFVSSGTHVMAEGLIWPLFVFVILQDYFSLGIVGSILAGISAILIFAVGKLSDSVNRRSIIWGITGFESLAWFLRSAVQTTGHVFAVTIFGAITAGIRASPLGALEYDKARGDISGYFVSREIFICLGRILILVFVLITNSLSGGLIFQGVANLASLLF